MRANKNVKKGNFLQRERFYRYTKFYGVMWFEYGLKLCLDLVKETNMSALIFCWNFLPQKAGGLFEKEMLFMGRL
jgi:hypothetical protein